LNSEVGIFGLKLVVVGCLEGQFDVAESQSNYYKKGQDTNGTQAVQHASRQLQLTEPSAGVRDDNKGIKALAHSLLHLSSREGQSPLKFHIYLNKKDLMAINRLN